MEISLVIPSYNEEQSLVELSEWIARVLGPTGLSYEVIFVDDGSTDHSWSVIEELSSHDQRIRGIQFQRNYGKSAALHVGFESTTGDVVVTMDADLQDSPDEVPELYRMITIDGYDLVSGWKQKRHDPILSKNFPSKLYNWAVRRMSGIRLHDFNCGIKAYKSSVVKSIEVYGDMHRYIPVLAKWAGFNRIGEKVVIHQERKYGVTKFGIERFIRGPLDLMSVMFISRFGKRPMHFFGSLGACMFIVGLAAAVYLGARKLILLSRHIKAELVTQSPYFYIALTAMILGTQLFLAGFLGELISRSAAGRNQYLISKRVR